MKALILVGGYGTRLRPFTFTLPKPLVPFTNKPIVMHQIEALVKAGVKEVILAVNYQPQVMVEYLKKQEQELGVKITISQEEVPLGTAGPLALARDLLSQDDEPFFMFNSDVICEFPLTEMLAFHRSHGKEGTIMVTPVQDPSKYGVVLSDGDGKIAEFIEKPAVFISDKINAGLYLFSPSILNRIELRPTSIERDIFPLMAADENLYSMTLPGYWMDIGQPADYLTGTRLHLDYLRRTRPDELDARDGIVGNVIVHESAKIGAGCKLGPNVVIGPDVVVQDGARIRDSCLFSRVLVHKNAHISSSIIGWDSRVGAWTRVDACYVGEDVALKDEIYTHCVTVLPHKGVKVDTVGTPGNQKIVI